MSHTLRRRFPCSFIIIPVINIYKYTSLCTITVSVKLHQLGATASSGYYSEGSSGSSSTSPTMEYYGHHVMERPKRFDYGFSERLRVRQREIITVFMLIRLKIQFTHGNLKIAIVLNIVHTGYLGVCAAELLHMHAFPMKKCIQLMQEIQFLCNANAICNYFFACVLLEQIRKFVSLGDSSCSKGGSPIIIIAPPSQLTCASLIGVCLAQHVYSTLTPPTVAGWSLARMELQAQPSYKKTLCFLQEVEQRDPEWKQLEVRYCCVSNTTVYLWVMSEACLIEWGGGGGGFCQCLFNKMCPS